MAGVAYTPTLCELLGGHVGTLWAKLPDSEADPIVEELFDRLGWSTHERGLAYDVAERVASEIEARIEAGLDDTIRSEALWRV